MDSKAFYQSKTLWGSAAVVIGFGLQAAGVSVPATEISHALDNLSNAISDLLAFGGFATMVYGRIVAKHPIALWNKKA